LPHHPPISTETRWLLFKLRQAKVIRPGIQAGIGSGPTYYGKMGIPFTDLAGTLTLRGWKPIDIPFLG
jgi:hypothetical protein